MNNIFFIYNHQEKLSFTLPFTITLDSKSSNPVFPEHPKKYVSRGIQMPFLLGFNRNEGIFLIRSNFFEGNKEVLHFIARAYTITKYIFNYFACISFTQLVACFSIM